MTTQPIRSLVAVLLAFGLGVACAAFGRAHAEPQPALDRGLVERVVRAQEAQAHQLEALVRATEKCKR
jgi:uncharacterized protein HemX